MPTSCYDGVRLLEHPQANASPAGAKTTGRITVTGGKASYRSATSERIVTLSEESGKDVLTFVPASGRAAAKLERVK